MPAAVCPAYTITALQYGEILDAPKLAKYTNRNQFQVLAVCFAAPNFISVGHRKNPGNPKPSNGYTGTPVTR